MKLKVKLDEGAKMPTRAHEYDAGLDIYAPDSIILYAGNSAKVDTGVHIEIPKGYCGLLKSKSGLNVNHGITGEGVIDHGTPAASASSSITTARTRRCTSLKKATSSFSF